MSQFVEYLSEVFAQLGPIQSRKMFEGYGVFYDGVMFGLVADDTLYLKADADTSKYFTERNLTPFEYDKAGKVMKMSYYLAPEEIYDDSEMAALWAKRAYEVAYRSKKSSKKTGKKVAKKG